MTAAARRTRGVLADGREIIWFDDPGAPARVPAEDTRDIPPAHVTSDIRIDDLTGDAVAIAAHRMERIHLPPPDLCPLCPSRPGAAATEVPSADYDVVVFENRFPSFAGGSGRCEVVCFTSDHEGSFAALDVQRSRTVVDAWADRTAELSARADVAHVAVFENRGADIGVTLHHPHGQVYGYPFVPPRIEAIVRRSREHSGSDDIVGDSLEEARADGSRMVVTGDAWSAYVPRAARWPVEVRVVPHRAVPDLAALAEEERDELAAMQLDVIRRVEQFVPREHDVPYIAAWHQAPVREGRHLVRLHLQVLSIRRAPGKLKYLAGSESAYGAWINDATPEQIAARLRDVA